MCFNVKSEIPSYLHNHYDVSILEGTNILSAPTSFLVKYSPNTRRARYIHLIAREHVLLKITWVCAYKSMCDKQTECGI